jgi:hypothetical protein
MSLNDISPQTILAGPTKPCGKCRIVKLLTDFNRSVAQRDGLQWACRQCDKETRDRNRKPRSPTKLSWNAMKDRCYWPGHPKYENYGGRGIVVCEQWLGKQGYKNFVADLGERPAGKTLDRYPDINGNYEPGNCRWATPVEQSRGRRNVGAVAFGRKQCIRAWAEEYGLTTAAVKGRMFRGMTLEQALLHRPQPGVRLPQDHISSSQSIET